MLRIFEFFCIKICKRNESNNHAEILKKDIRRKSVELNKQLKKMNRLLERTVAEDIFKASGGGKE